MNWRMLLHRGAAHILCTHQVAAVYCVKYIGRRPKCDVKSKIRLCQSMHIYFRNNPAKILSRPNLKQQSHWHCLKRLSPTRTTTRWVVPNLTTGYIIDTDYLTTIFLLNGTLW